MAKVRFVSYDGAYPNLCRGTLVLEINGKPRIFDMGALYSTGGIWYDDECMWHTRQGKWQVDVPPDLAKYQREIEDCVNENVPHGCCGGCI